MSEHPFRPLNEEERALARRLGLPLEVPPPRRTDAAFSLAVRREVAEREQRRPSRLVALATVSALALALVFGLTVARPSVPAAHVASTAELLSASLEVVDEESEAVAVLDDDSLLAFSAALDDKLGF